MSEPPPFDPHVFRLWSQLRDAARTVASVRVVGPGPVGAAPIDERESHPVATVVGSLAGVVRVELAAVAPVDLRPGQLLVLAAGVWHRHAPLRAGSAAYEQGFITGASDLLLSCRERSWRGRLPSEPSQSLVAAIIAARAPERRCRLAAELLGQFGQRVVEAIPPAHPAVERMVEFLRRNRRRPITAADVIRASALSRSRAHRLFLLHQGETPKQALLRDRLQIASGLLAGGAGIAEAAARSGFTGTADLSRSFRRRYGASPRAWLRARSGQP